MAPAPYSVGAGTPVSGRAGLSRGPFPARSIGPERFRGPVAPSAEAGRFGTGRPRSPARDQRVRAVMALRHGRWQRRRVGGSPDFRSIIGLYSSSGGQRPCAEPSSPKTACGAPCGTTVTGRSSTRNAGPMPAGSPRAGRRWPPPRCARRRGRAWSPCVPMNGSATAGRSTSPPIPAAGGPDREAPPPRPAPASSRSSSGPSCWRPSHRATSCRGSRNPRKFPCGESRGKAEKKLQRIFLIGLGASQGGKGNHPSILQNAF
ncbi:Uncharacterised protein [Roseomonas gilardii subsp. rosea]|nr:Uncharacterised protein [Roseomonas gilardii subsp. rosea]